MNGRNKAMCYTKDIHSYRKFSRNQSKEGISMSSIETFLQMVKESDNIVFFGGAGVSTESGNDPESFFLCKPYGRVLSFLPG